MPAALPGYDSASSWLAQALTAVPYQPDCGSSGGCDSLNVNQVHQGAHLIGVGARGIPAVAKAAPRSKALPAALQRDLLRNGVPHRGLGSAHVARERRHLLLGPQEAAQHTQELTDLGLFEIPRFVFKCAPTLRKLDLSNNQLGSLPSEIQHLTALESLLVPRNGLTALPDSALSGMRALTELDCSKNELAGSLFEHVFTKALSKLQRLDASSNKLLALCGSVSELPALRTLDVSGNDIKVLPDDVLLGPSLVRLDARRNPLIQLPANARAGVLQHSMPVTVAVEGYGKSLLLGGADCAANARSMRACRVTHVLAIDERAHSGEELPFDQAAEWWSEMFDATVEPVHGHQPNALLAALPRCLTWMRAALAHGRRHGLTVPLVDPPAAFYNAPMQPSGHAGVDHSQTLSNSCTTTHDDTLAAAKLMIFSPTDMTKAVAVAVGFVMAAEGKSLDQAVSSVLGGCGVHDVSEEKFRASHWAHELLQLEAYLNEQPEPTAQELSYCWQNHLAAKRVMPAVHPAPDCGVHTQVPGAEHLHVVPTEHQRDWSCGREEEKQRALLGRPGLSALPLQAAGCVMQLMRQEARFDTTVKESELVVLAAEKEMLQSEFPAEAHEKLMELRAEKAALMGTMDENFANLAVITEDLGCHVFSGGTIHSHLH